MFEFTAFDSEYVGKLAEGDPATESHFGRYFGKFLALKLRSRRLDPTTAEDIVQETLYRVLKTLRQGNGVAQPERFGAFVNAVCNNVVHEASHKKARDGPAGEEMPEITDSTAGADAALISAERKRQVRAILDDLSAKDREILKLVFFEEEDREEICRRLGVEAEYLRVLLHRAKARFQSAFVRKHGLDASAFFFMCNALGPFVTIW